MIHLQEDVASGIKFSLLYFNCISIRCLSHYKFNWVFSFVQVNISLEVSKMTYIVKHFMTLR